MNKWQHAAAAGFAVAVSIVGWPASAYAAQTHSVAYFRAQPWAYLIEWSKDSTQARVVGDVGAQPATVVDDGTQRVVTLAEPFPSNWVLMMYDPKCGSRQIRRFVHQLVVRDLPGQVTQIVEIGETVNDVVNNTDQCPDTVTPFGLVTDKGVETTRVPFSKRPPMDDLVAGLKIAGPSEERWGGEWPAQDIVTVQAGGATFRKSGKTVPTHFSKSGWWVFQLESSQNAFSRLLFDDETGGETWLAADWVDGKAQRVTAFNFVKPTAGAGFGFAAKKWEHGSTVGIKDSSVFNLYLDGTGDWVWTSKKDGSWQDHIDAWGMDGPVLWQQTILDSSYSLMRRWEPLHNHGKKIHWVLDESVSSSQEYFPYEEHRPLVVYYLDKGEALPPAAR